MSNPSQPSQPRLHIFNAIHTATPNDGNDHALQRPRIITISLRYLPAQWNEAQVPYFVGADRYWLFNELLRVSREARMVALKFYRVRIPCTAQPGFLYFNPEHDFINFEYSSRHRRWMYARKVIGLIHFIHDLKFTYDPRQVGLLKLDIATGSPLARVPPDNELWCTESPSVNASFAQIHMQLREFIFMETPSDLGRSRMVGSVSRTGTIETLPNRPFPILNWIPTFERLQSPRLIFENLEHLFIAFDPARAFLNWRRPLDMWAVVPSAVEYWTLLAFHPQGGDPPRYDCHMSYLDAIDNSAKAFGLWLFPLHALGPMPPNGGPYRVFKKRLAQFAGHWPRLGLARLY